MSINRLNLAEYCPEELLWVDKLARSLSEGSAWAASASYTGSKAFSRLSSSAASELTLRFSIDRGREPRHVRKILERLARIGIARLDRPIECTPIEQVDVRERRLRA